MEPLSDSHFCIYNYFVYEVASLHLQFCFPQLQLVIINSRQKILTENLIYEQFINTDSSVQGHKTLLYPAYVLYRLCEP